MLELICCSVNHCIGKSLGGMIRVRINSAFVYFQLLKPMLCQRLFPALTFRLPENQYFDAS